MVQEKVQVLWNKRVGPAYYKIGLTCHEGYSYAQPGQFIMLGLTDRLDPLLRRPFSIHRIIAGNEHIEGVELLYKVVGVTTKNMAMLKKGDTLSLLGPLGKGFVISDDYQRVFIVAGGIGVAPMPFLASFLKEKGAVLSESRVFLGGGSKDDLLCTDEFLRLDMAVHITTDDGSSGDQCLVTFPLENKIKDCQPDVIYACGPVGMLTCVIHMAREYSIPCQVSVETIMACGMGACLGCAIGKKDAPDKYLHACLDGPVFDAKKVELETRHLNLD